MTLANAVAQIFFGCRVAAQLLYSNATKWGSNGIRGSPVSLGGSQSLLAGMIVLISLPALLNRDDGADTMAGEHRWMPRVFTPNKEQTWDDH